MVTVSVLPHSPFSFVCLFVSGNGSLFFNHLFTPHRDYITRLGGGGFLDCDPSGVGLLEVVIYEPKQLGS